MFLTVTEGKVSFSDLDQTVSEYVTVGEEAVLSVTKLSIDKRATANANTMAWKTGKLSFQADPLADIAATLSGFYDVTITVEPSLADRVYTFTIDQYSLEETIILLKSITGSKIVTEDKTYHITE